MLEKTFFFNIIYLNCKQRTLEESGGEDKPREGLLNRQQSLYYGSAIFYVWSQLYLAIACYGWQCHQLASSRQASYYSRLALAGA